MPRNAPRRGPPARAAREARHRNGPARHARTKTRRCALVEIARRRPNLELAGFMTHFATADEPDSDFFDEQLARFSPGRRRGQGTPSRLRRPRRQQRGRVSRAGGAFRHGALRHRGLRPRPFPRGPVAARARAGARARVVRRRHQAGRARATASATGAAGAPRATRAWRCCRSATATGIAAASPTMPT